jgi:hypothetical protein
VQLIDDQLEIDAMMIRLTMIRETQSERSFVSRDDVLSDESCTYKVMDAVSEAATPVTV